MRYRLKERREYFGSVSTGRNHSPFSASRSFPSVRKRSLDSLWTVWLSLKESERRRERERIFWHEEQICRKLKISVSEHCVSRNSLSLSLSSRAQIAQCAKQSRYGVAIRPIVRSMDATQQPSNATFPFARGSENPGRRSGDLR